MTVALEIEAPPSETEDSESRRFWFIFLFVLLASFVVHLSTIHHSPGIWNDEVQILDYSRVLFDPQTNWSLTIDDQGRAGLCPNPVYLIVLKAIGTLFGISPVTTRALAYASAIVAVLLFWCLLRSLRVSPLMCTLAGLAFWFDPLFIKSFRGARADAFAMALALAACWTWNEALHRRSRSRAMLAGILVIAALLTWPTASVTLCLGLAIYAAFVAKERSWAFREIVWVVLGGLLVIVPYLAIYYLPYKERISSTLTDSYHMGRTPVWNAVMRSFGEGPWTAVAFCVAMLTAVCRRQGIALLSAVLLGMGLILLAPMVHYFRVVYLLPCAYALVAKAFPSTRAVYFGLAALVILPSAAIHCGARVVTAFIDAPKRDYAIIGNRLEELIPAGSTVVSGPGSDTEHYYVGLSNGWRMFSTNAEAVVPDLQTFYLLVEHERPLPGWAAECDCKLVDTIKSPPIRQPLSNREFRLYESRVYRCSNQTSAQ